jgi:hypothetical protein
MSQEIDDILSAISVKYAVPPLSLSAIVLARLIRLAEQVEADDDFKKIMANAIQVTRKEDRVLQ